MDFVQRARLITLVTDATHGNFYRTFYGLNEGVPAKEIDTEEEWCALPLLTKDNIMERSLKERVHIALRTIDHLRPSSGTSGKGPLFSPRTPLRGMEYRLAYHDFKKPLIAYTVPAMPHWHEEFQALHGSRVATVSFDPANPAACARLARDAGADGMSLFAFHIPLIAPHLVREGIADDIRFIEIAGEACTRKLYDFMRSTFPNAAILPFYGSSEVEDSPIGMPCRAITGEEPLSLYHGKPSHYMEVIDPESGNVLAPNKGVEGELVITAYPGEPSSFPLIRFRTGDTVRVIDEHCARHGTWSFTILGRTAMDFIKVPGGVLRADEIERVLRTMPEDVTDSFELHCSETDSPAGPLFTPTLLVELKRSVDLNDLASRVSEQLRVSSLMTYAVGAQEGRYAALACRSYKPSEGSKTKRIVRT
jgi:phenylacetate-coenzyme A ligase PaaK-like adenylate-forming protein